MTFCGVGFEFTSSRTFSTFLHASSHLSRAQKTLIQFPASQHCMSCFDFNLISETAWRVKKFNQKLPSLLEFEHLAGKDFNDYGRRPSNFNRSLQGTKHFLETFTVKWQSSLMLLSRCHFHAANCLNLLSEARFKCHRKAILCENFTIIKRQIPLTTFYADEATKSCEEENVFQMSFVSRD